MLGMANTAVFILRLVVIYLLQLRELCLLLYYFPIHLARKYCHLAHYRGAKQHLCHAEHPAEGWAFQLQFEGPCKLCHTQQRLKQQSCGQVEVAAFCVNIFVSC